MKVNKKYKALCMGWNTPMHQYTTGTDCLSSSFVEKHSKGNMLNVNLNISQKCTIIANGAKQALSCIRRSTADRLK